MANCDFCGDPANDTIFTLLVAEGNGFREAEQFLCDDCLDNCTHIDPTDGQRVLNYVRALERREDH